jgi:hypothetical protein
MAGVQIPSRTDKIITTRTIITMPSQTVNSIESQATRVPRIWNYFLNDLMRDKIRDEFPGASFGQQSKIASAFYKSVPEDRKAWLKQELSMGHKPELNDLYPLEDAMERKSKLFAGLQYLFDINMGSYQRQWWSGKVLVDAINRLSQVPFNKVFNPGRKPFESKEIQKALQKGLGSLFLADDGDDCYGDHTSKSHFFIKSPRTRQGTFHFLYVNTRLPETPGMVEAIDASEFDGVKSKQMDEMEFLPLDLIDLINYWHSPECEMTFIPLDDETTREAVMHQAALLQQAANDKTKMMLLIDGLGEKHDDMFCRDLLLGDLSATGDEWVRLPVQIAQADIDELVADYQKVSLYISVALNLVLEEDGISGPVHWKKKCGAAVQKLKSVGITHFTGEVGVSVLNWFAVFRRFRCFPNLLLEAKRYGPSLLLKHPRLVKRALDFANENLDKLNTKLMHDHFHTVLLPQLIEEKRAEFDDHPDANIIRQEITIDVILREHNVKSLCMQTINNWMHFMGLDRHRYKKGCFTDIHNKPENIEANLRYCINIVTNLEFRSACWVQLTAERAKELQGEGRINKSYVGYMYDSNRMAEYHVDDVEGAYKLPELESSDAGGLLSVRKEALFPGTRELLMFGHDEAVAHENSQNSFTWIGRGGEQPLRPKDLGTALHMSAYVSRQVGWHPKPSTMQLGEINFNRQGTKYLAEELAIKLYGTAEKNPLTAEDESFCW